MRVNGMHHVLVVQGRQGFDRIGVHDMQSSAPSSKVTVQAFSHVQLPLEVDGIDIGLLDAKRLEQHQAQDRPT